MRIKTGLKRLAALLASLVLLLALALPGGAADTGSTEEVEAQLERLLSVDINWRWLPDIEHNQAAVQNLLDAYLACTPAQRAGFTDAQNEDLHGYFTALYTIQGKDLAEVDALFEGGAAPPSSSSQSSPETSSQPQESSSGSASDSGAAGSQSQSQSGSSSQAQSSSGGPPASSQTDASQSTPDMPVISNPPQTPGGEGWMALFGNNALAVVVVAVLLLLVVVLFIRFLVSLRRAGKPSRADASAAARAQELFGEDYEEEALPDSLPPAARRAEEADGDEDGDEDGEGQPSRRQRRRDEKRAKADAKAEARAAALAGEDDSDDDPFAGVAPAKTAAPARPTSKPAAKEEPAAPTREPGPQAAENRSAPPVDKPDLAVDKKTVVAPGGDVFVQSSTSRDPDAPNAISMRSFSGQPRTGRPAKMTFRQGEPNDIDAIDE